jgi:hypothetical protein
MVTGPPLGHSAKCREFGISRKNFKKWKRIPPSEIPLFGEPLGKNRELSGVIGESGKIGNYRDSDFSRFLPRITDSGKIGNDRE